MRRSMTLIVVASLALGGGAGAGLAIGELMAHHRVSPYFDVDDWPSRGKGDVLIEFSDPACPLSRRLDRELQNLESRHRFRRALVPVDVVAHSGEPDEVPLAEALCAATDEEAFKFTIAFDESFSIVNSRNVSVGRRDRDCRYLVRAATAYLSQLMGRSAAAPVVLYHDNLYIGLDNLDRLARELEQK